MKKILLPVAALLSLSACGLFHREGVGFTGLNGEPTTFTEQRGSADYVARRLSVPAELAGLPTVRLQQDAGDIERLANVAISNGGRTPLNAVEVEANNQNFMLSTVEVNGVLFGVLRAPENTTNRLPEGAGNAFLASVPRLTGCLPAGNTAYASGSANRPTGVAVPLNCK